MLLPVPHLGRWVGGWVDGWLVGSLVVGWLIGWLVGWFVESSMCYPPAPSWITDDVSEGEMLAGRKKLINAAMPVGPDVRTRVQQALLGICFFQCPQR